MKKSLAVIALIAQPANAAAPDKEIVLAQIQTNCLGGSFENRYGARVSVESLHVSEAGIAKVETSYLKEGAGKATILIEFPVVSVGYAAEALPRGGSGKGVYLDSQSGEQQVRVETRMVGGRSFDGAYARHALPCRDAEETVRALNALKQLHADRLGSGTPPRIRPTTSAGYIAPLPSFARAVQPRDVGAWMPQVSTKLSSPVYAGELEETIRFRVSIDADGRVARCTVLSGVRKEAVKNSACAAIRRHANFEPALDNAGNPTTGSWGGTIDQTDTN